MKETGVRDSNFELARIVAMAMIVIWHFIIHGFWGEDRFLAIDSFGPLHFDQYVQLGVSVLCIVGVNLFILISGYYRISLKWKSLLNYYLLCLFYNAVILLASSFYQAVSLKDILSVFFISNTANWFFKAYFILLLVSPVLNAAIRSFSMEQYRIVVAMILLLVCVSGWLFRNGNDNGYNAYQLLAMYMIGGYVSREQFFDKIKSGRAFGLFLIMSALNYISMLVVYYVLGKEITTLLHYNYLLLILQSVSLFCVFRNLNVKNRKSINLLASTVVAVLFIQENVINVPLYSYIHSEYMSNGFSIGLFLFLVAVFFGLFALAFIVESIRKKLTAPFVAGLSDKLNKVIPIAFNK